MGVVRCGVLGFPQGFLVLYFRISFEESFEGTSFELGVQVSNA